MKRSHFLVGSRRDANGFCGFSPGASWLCSSGGEP